MQPDDLLVHMFGWVGALVLVAALSAPLRRATGAGIWSLRAAITLAVAMISTTGFAGLFGENAGLFYGLGVLVLAGGAVMLARRESFDVFGLSAVGLGLDALLVGGFSYLLLHNAHGDGIGILLFIGLAAAGLVAATVSVVLRLQQRHEGARS